MKKIIITLLIYLIYFNPINAAPDAAEQKSAWEAAEKAATHGPATITIADQAQIKLPDGYAYIPEQPANRFMIAAGNFNSQNLQGLIVPISSDNPDTGIYTIYYVGGGHIKDNDANDLNPDTILKGYTKGTELMNQKRAKQGFPEFDLGGWSQPPVYDKEIHRLTWALITRNKGVPAGSNDGVNYETRILGREGYLSMTWLGKLNDLNAKGKSNADHLTAQVQYIEGKRYEDFSASAGDKVAEYGLAALITGVVAKKLGFFAIALAFLAKFAKIILIAVFGGFAAFKHFFSRKNKSID